MSDMYAGWHWRGCGARYTQSRGQVCRDLRFSSCFQVCQVPAAAVNTGYLVSLTVTMTSVSLVPASMPQVAILLPILQLAVAVLLLVCLSICSCHILLLSHHPYFGIQLQVQFHQDRASVCSQELLLKRAVLSSP
jgi:hypothetical protein